MVIINNGYNQDIAMIPKKRMIMHNHTLLMDDNLDSHFQDIGIILKKHGQ